VKYLICSRAEYPRNGIENGMKMTEKNLEKENILFI
jgi:hypothetical protein